MKFPKSPPNIFLHTSLKWLLPVTSALRFLQMYVVKRLRPTKQLTTLLPSNTSANISFITADLHLTGCVKQARFTFLHFAGVLKMLEWLFLLAVWNHSKGLCSSPNIMEENVGKEKNTTSALPLSILHSPLWRQTQTVMCGGCRWRRMQILRKPLSLNISPDSCITFCLPQLRWLRVTTHKKRFWELKPTQRTHLPIPQPWRLI